MENRKTTFLSLLGMASFWPLLRRNCASALSAVGTVPDDAAQWTYLAFLCIFAASGIVAGVRLFRGATKARSVRRLLLSLLAVGTFGMFAASCAADASTAASVAIAVVASCCNAALVALLAVAWGVVAGRAFRAHRVLVCAGAFALGFVLSLPFVVVPGSDALWTAVLTMTSGLLSVAALSSNAVSFDDLPVPCEKAKRSLARAMGGITVVLVLFLLVGGVIRGAVGSGALTSIGVAEQFVAEKALLSVGLALVVLAVVYFSEENGRFAYACWAVLSVAFFAGLFYIALYTPDNLQLLGVVIIPCRTFLGFLLWMVLVESAWQNGSSAALLVGCVFVPTEALSWILSDYAVMAAVNWFGFNVRASLGPLSLLMALFLIAAVFLLLRTSSTSREPQAVGGIATSETHLAAGTAETSEGASDTRRRQAVERLREEFSLTEREAEVALLISQGHSYKRISESLFISQSTTQSHVRNLYRKVGVHSRQELIDLVNDGS